MNGVHDMGGMHGFGPIVREENEPLFHAAWEARVRAMVVIARSRGYFNIDAFRYGIERMDPAHYLRASYFERWLASIELNLIEHGFLTGDELDARTAFFREHPEADASARRRRRARAGSAGRERRAAAAGAALRGGRRRGDAQRPPARPHPAPALRARQAGRHPTPAWTADLPRHQRPRAGRATRSRSTASASTPASCGGTPPSRARRSPSTCGRAISSPLRLETRRSAATGRGRQEGCRR